MLFKKNHSYNNALSDIKVLFSHLKTVRLVKHWHFILNYSVTVIANN